MARKVKLQDTGEFSTNDVAWKAPNGKYYSSAENYEKIVKNSENRQKCIVALADICGFVDGAIMPTITLKKLKEFEKVGYDVVYDTIVNKEKDILWAIQNKNFNNESYKMMYVMSIVKNGLADTYKKKQRELKQDNKTEVHIEADVEVVEVGNQKKGSDVSSLLGSLDGLE